VTVHISAKWSDLNTRKGKAEGRATSLQGREGNAIASVAASTVGAMTSLLLLVIAYTDTQNEKQNDQSLNLLLLAWSTKTQSSNFQSVVVRELSSGKTRSPAVARIADRTDNYFGRNENHRLWTTLNVNDNQYGRQWPSRSSKVDDFHFIWKNICHFLFVINSNLGRISYRFQHMASFPLNFLPLHLTPNLNIPLALDGWNFACPSLTHIANYLCKKFSPRTYPLARVHPLRTKRQKDGQTDNNHANSLTVT